jgi:MFS family permease
VGAVAFSPWVGLAVMVVLLTVVASYRQNVHAYPSGGGDYEIANENLGKFAGLTVASALLVDYVLTVAVSMSSAAAYLTTAVPSLHGQQALIATIGVVILALVNLRGIKEAGSVFGPIYGATFASAAATLGGWRFVFWLNIPLAAICGAGLLIANRARRMPLRSDEPRGQVDWKSAGLLGLGLGLLVVALYPDDPTHRATSGLFVPLGILSLIVLGLYGWRQVHVLDPLIPRQLLRSPRFAGAAGANLLIGAALMVALVDVPILGRLVFDLDQLAAGRLLTNFLVGVPLGAILGGFLAGRIGARVTAVLGSLLAAAAFLQMSTWQAGELALRIGPIRPADITLAACGLGFGIVIAPLAATVLQLTRAQHHGLASSLVVLARVIGMLVGLSALTAFGLFRFREILGTPQLTDPDLRARIEHLGRLVAAAFLQEYREIFTIAAGLCILAAVVVFVTLRPPPRPR